MRYAEAKEWVESQRQSGAEDRKGVDLNGDV